MDWYSLPKVILQTSIFHQPQEEIYLFNYFESTGVHTKSHLKIHPNVSYKYSTVFPMFKGYNQHFITLTSSKMTYSFVKYMDKSYTTSTEFGSYMQLKKDSWLLDYTSFFDRYPQPCSNITHRPKVFSWAEAYRMCHVYFGRLPALFSQSEETNLIIALLSSADVFPLEAVFIALTARSTQKVSSYLHTKLYQLSVEPDPSVWCMLSVLTHRNRVWLPSTDFNNHKLSGSSHIPAKSYNFHKKTIPCHSGLQGRQGTSQKVSSAQQHTFFPSCR